MEIIVNGENISVVGMTIRDYLDKLSIDMRIIAVELNLELLHKSEFATTWLNDGDRIEIVQFVGGG